MNCRVNYEVHFAFWLGTLSQGRPLSFQDVPVRHSKREIGEQLEALYDQYDAEDFDLGIKQFMIEQAIQQVGNRL